MADLNKPRKAKFEPLVNGFYYDIVGEAFLPKDKDGQIIDKRFPRNYTVKFFIFLRPDEKVAEIEYTDAQHGLSADESTVVSQQVNLTTNNSTPPEKEGDGTWRGYEFEITKNEKDVVILEFSVNDTETDPKPKVIYTDPDEIDPGDGSGNH